MVPKIRTITLCLVSAALLLGLYQNCSAPGAKATGAASSSSTGGGSNSGSAATNPDMMRGVDPVCGNRVNNNGQCQDYACQRVIEITTYEELTNVPARDNQGTCYAMRMLTAMQGNSSDLSERDVEVLARNVENQEAGPRSPILMSGFQTEISLLGPRVIKLTGGLDVNMGVTVDDFFLVGLYPTSLLFANAPVEGYYRADGNYEVSVLNAQGQPSGFVQFRTAQVPFRTFGGVYTITNAVASNLKMILDVRGLDAGGQYGLSDVYLFFQ